MQKLLTAAECEKLYGPAHGELAMKLLILPTEILKNIPTLPARIYCNRDMHLPLLTALKKIIQAGIGSQIKTWDGCFNLRKSKGGSSASLHSWGVAIDINAAWNGYGKQPTISKELVDCFLDSGFDWGGDWKTPDGMHFQLSKGSVLS